MSRTDYLTYRCYTCGRLITALDLESMWEKAEQSEETLASICPCGSRRLCPGNPKWWEEILFPRVWKLFFVRVLLPRLRGEAVSNGPQG